VIAAAEEFNGLFIHDFIYAGFKQCCMPGRSSDTAHR